MKRFYRVVPVVAILFFTLTFSMHAQESGIKKRMSIPLENMSKSDGILDLAKEYSRSFGHMVQSENGKPIFEKYLDCSKNIQLKTTELEDNWDDRFAFPGPGVDGSIYTIFIDGTNVYIGGSFTQIGDVSANHIAKWDGNTWSPLGSGVDSPVIAVAVNGNYVYAGGYSTFQPTSVFEGNCIEIWDGNTWSGTGMFDWVSDMTLSDGDVYIVGHFGTPFTTHENYCITKWNGIICSSFGNGLYSYVINTIAVNGSDMYVGGNEIHRISPGSDYINVAKWDGNIWSSLGSGVDDEVNAIAVNGSDVYVGGKFYHAGGMDANYIAKWDGSTWYSLGSGVNGRVDAITVSGSDVYVGGWFTQAGGADANHIAKWDGSAWESLGNDVNGGVSAIAVSGSDVYVGGGFLKAGDVNANRIAKWNGNTWSSLGNESLGSGMNDVVNAVAVCENNIYVAGNFTQAGNIDVDYIAKWNGIAWSTIGSGVDGRVKSMYVNGSDVFVIGEGVSNYIAKWDGSTWSSLGSGEWVEQITTLAISGSDVFIGGWFEEIDGITVNHIAKWDGSTWSSLGSGVDDGVNTIAISGNDVYVGGGFEEIDGITVNYIAKWDGSTWSSLGNGIYDGIVNIIAISGNDVYVGGELEEADGITLNNVAKWNGSTWCSLGDGVDGPVDRIAISGSDIYVEGDFEEAGGIPANNIAKWNGSTWSSLGDGIGDINVIAVSGDNLYVGGPKRQENSYATGYIAKWDGSTWSYLESELNGTVASIAVNGNDVFFGGSFTRVGGKSSSYIACWHESGLESLTIISPNGGENWFVGGNHDITWTSSGTSGTVKIEYSTDSGSTWTDIVTSTDDDGTYSWTVPNTPSDQCLIRVSDTDGDPSDVSDTVFSIIEPIADLRASVNGQNILLDWTAPDGATEFNIYRGTTYNFAPDLTNGTNRIGDHITDQDESTEGIQWTDTGNGADIVGDPNVNYFYQVTAFVPATQAAVKHAASSINPKGTPHTATGQIYNSDSSLPGNTDIQFSAYITTRPEEVLTQASFGSGYQDGYWVVSVGNFPSDWSAGEILHLDIENTTNGESGVLEMTLTNDDPDMAPDLTLSHIVESSPSNTAGEFDIALTTTEGTNINEVVLVMETSEIQNPITTAEELANAIPNCSVVYYWDAAGQGTMGHPKGLPFNNFAVQTGYPYPVNVTADGVWTVAGKVSHASFNLVTTENTDINHIGLPLNQNDLTTAEELGEDITDCTVVYYWDVAGQGTMGHPIGLPFNNFAVTPGHAYYVNVTGNSTWPQENVASLSLAKNQSRLHNLDNKRSPGAGIPHLAYGEYQLAKAKDKDCSITLKSWIEGREEEILTESHVGVGFDERYWWVEVSNLESPWQVGDVLHVELLVNGGEYSGTQSIPLSTNGADVGNPITINYTPERILPTQYALLRNYPNPFNPETHIGYELPEESNIRLEIYDVTGSLVRTLVNKQQSAGRYEVIWDGKNTHGNRIVSGLYFYKMTTPKYTHVQKMMLVK